MLLFSFARAKKADVSALTAGDKEAEKYVATDDEYSNQVDKSKLMKVHPTTIVFDNLDYFVRHTIVRSWQVHTDCLCLMVPG